MGLAQRKRTPYKLSDRFKFGKYKDKTVDEIVKFDNSYIHWLWSRCECKFEKEVLDLMETVIEENRYEQKRITSERKKTVIWGSLKRF